MLFCRSMKECREFGLYVSRFSESEYVLFQLLPLDPKVKFRKPYGFNPWAYQLLSGRTRLCNSSNKFKEIRNGR